MKTVAVIASFFAVVVAYAGEIPTAQVTEIANKTVSVKNKGPVPLDAAYKFEATEESATYADWIADFVVTFDRDVVAGAVELYGQTDLYGSDWIAQELGAVQANEPKRLINEKDLTYAALLSSLPVFNCGAKSDIAGLKLTVELRLYKPSDANIWVTIAHVDYKFAGKWFNARVEQYSAWPEDAEKAYGGSWADTGNAEVMTPGELLVNGDISFDVDDQKTLGEDVSKATVEGVADFSFIEEGACFPDVLDVAKGGVLVAKDGEELSYYAIARDGETNAWIKLEGPEARTGMTPFKMTYVRKWTGGTYGRFATYVSYNINGTDYEYWGDREIEVVDTDSVLSGVGFGGSGELGSLSATVERIRRNMMYFVK